MDLSRYKGHTFYIVGMARSGLSTLHALRAAGAIVFAWDDRDVDGVVKTPFNDVPYNELTAVILSPGVPKTHPAAVRAINEEIDLISDVELAFRAGINAQTIGITGTNGKSTVTALTKHVLTALGESVVIAGNFGEPIFDVNDPGETGFIVLELSSYQLELSPGYNLTTACLLNLSTDHLDRHKSMSSYAKAKANIFNRAESGFVLGTDEWCQNIAQKGMAALIDPTSWPPLPDNPALVGNHQRQNCAAVLEMLKYLGFEHNEILTAMDTFPGLAHRQEVIGADKKWLFVNDSKATNPISTAIALKAYTNIHWLAGGQGKDGGLADLNDALKCVEKAYLFGENAPELADLCLMKNVPFKLFDTLAQATATALAENGGTLLLSPAAASWDQYQNFAERGEHFRHLIQTYFRDGAAK